MAQIHSTFSKNRHGRFQGSKLFEQLFERILAQCLEVGLGRTFGRGSETSGRENIASDSLDRRAAGCPVAGPDADAALRKRQLWTRSGLAVETHASVRSIVMRTDNCNVPSGGPFDGP